MTKITTIPDDLRAQFPAIVEAAIADGLRCEPADRPTAEAALRDIYRLSGLDPNVPIIWVPSPLVGAFAASIADRLIGDGSAVHSAVYSAVDSAVDSAVYSAVYSAVDSAVYRAVGSAVYNAVHSAVDSAVGSAVDSAVGSAVYNAVHSAVDSAVDSAVGSAVDSAVGSAVYNAVHSAVDSAVYSAVYSAVDSAVGSAAESRICWHPWRGGQFWVAWPAFVETIMRLGVDHPSFEALRAEAKVCRSAGYYWPNKHFIMVCERPQAIRRDADGRLHCETGPSVDYGETFRLYSWHGTTIPREWIEDRASLTAAVALKWKNVEQRRCACEILGWNRILDELGATVIDEDGDPEIGTLVEVDLPDSGK